jgi:hypothetical protein
VYACAAQVCEDIAFDAGAPDRGTTGIIYGVDGRGIGAIGAGVTVVLGAVSAALINQVGAGPRWWAAAASVVLISAVLTAWLAFRASSTRDGDVLGAGAVKAGRDIEGSVETDVADDSTVLPPSSAAGGDALGLGAVKANGSIHGDVKTRVKASRPGSPGQ